MARQEAVTAKIQAINAKRVDDPFAAFTDATDQWRRLYKEMTDRLGGETDPMHADEYCELLYAAFVAGNSSLKKDWQWAHAAVVFERMSTLITYMTPLAEIGDEEHAKELGDFWDNSFEGINIQPIVLQEIIFFLQKAEFVFDSKIFGVMAQALSLTLEQYYQEHREERFGDIFAIKHGKAGAVHGAYMNYFLRSDVSRGEVPADERMYLRNVALGRTLAHDLIGFSQLQRISKLKKAEAVRIGAMYVGKKAREVGVSVLQLLQALLKGKNTKEKMEEVLPYPGYYGFGNGEVREVDDIFSTV